MTVAFASTAAGASSGTYRYNAPPVAPDFTIGSTTVCSTRAEMSSEQGGAVNRRPNILLVVTDQLRYPPRYESEDVRQFHREKLTAEESLRETGVSFRRHYTMAAACAPSRASVLTGHYPSLHGVTQTDGLAKSAESDDMFWLAPDTVPTLGDWVVPRGPRWSSMRLVSG